MQHDPADLLADLAVRKLDAGRYATTVTPAWSYVYPSGGLLMSLVLRAMQAELDDATQTVVSATAIYATPVPAGPATIEVAVLRRGRAASQLRARMRADAVEGEGLEVTATFAAARPGPDFLDATPPVVPAPDDAEDEHRASGNRLGVPFFHNFDVRIAEGRPWWYEDWKPQGAWFARWFRYRVPPRTGDGTLDPLAIPIVADTMPPALYMKLGPEMTLYCPSFDLTLHFLEAPRGEWLLVRTHCRRARAGWATADCEVWGDDGRLVAVATQTMMVRDGVPGARPDKLPGEA